MRILVTAGPTREFIDPVRFMSNRSSGKMGYALALKAKARGHEVRLISGPVVLPDPEEVTCCHIVSAEEMNQAVLKSLEWCDALIMAAAVADWRPRGPSKEKLKKSAMQDHLLLERTPDILMNVSRLKGEKIIVGFAAETVDPLASASDKLRRKGLDLIVVNDVSKPDSGFEVDTNQVSLLSPDGKAEHLPLLPKADVAERIIDWIETRSRTA